MHNLHWYAAVVNARRREIQILDSMLSHTHRPELERTVICIIYIHYRFTSLVLYVATTSPLSLTVACNNLQLLGMEAHVNVSLSTHGAQNSMWPDSLLSTWPVVVKDTPQQ